MLTEQYVSTTDLLYTTEGKLLRVLCVFCAIGCPTAPLSVAIFLVGLGQTRITLPYHVFGDRYELMTPKCLSVLAADWAILSVGLMSFYAGFVVCIDAVMRITLICRVLR